MNGEVSVPAEDPRVPRGVAREQQLVRLDGTVVVSLLVPPGRVIDWAPPQGEITGPCAGRVRVYPDGPWVVLAYFPEGWPGPAAPWPEDAPSFLARGPQEEIQSYREAAEREYRRGERVVTDYRALTAEVIAGLSTSEHGMTVWGGLPFCRCGYSLDGGDARGAFITHALAVLATTRAALEAEPRPGTMTEAMLAFAAARLDEVEAAARLAASPSLHDPGWTAIEHADDGSIVVDAASDLVAVARPERSHGPAVAAHIACYGPDRALAEVAVKRAILAEYHRLTAVMRSFDEAGHPGLMAAGRWEGMRLAVQHLAAVWEKHPDYKRDWAPVSGYAKNPGPPNPVG